MRRRGVEQEEDRQTGMLWMRMELMCADCLSSLHLDGRSCIVWVSAGQTVFCNEITEPLFGGKYVCIPSTTPRVHLPLLPINRNILACLAERLPEKQKLMRNVAKTKCRFLIRDKLNAV